MAKETFPCVACGAPITPYPGAIRTVCEYCGCAANIPEDMRIAAKPAPGKAGPAQVKEESDIKLTEIVDKVQPVAIKAYNTFWLWTIIRRFLPGCLITLAVLCLLTCVFTFGSIFLMRQ